MASMQAGIDSVKLYRLKADYLSPATTIAFRWHLETHR
jgi:hypothetical protein